MAEEQVMGRQDGKSETFRRPEMTMPWITVEAVEQVGSSEILETV